MSNAYKKSGVDIDEGNRFIDLIKPIVKQTRRKGVVADVGGFAGLFNIDLQSYPKPVLVSGTDGVGTKLLLAQEVGNLSTIGIDLVAMCVNDIACCGAEPLFFLDYFAVGKLKPDEHIKIIEGIVEGCKQANCTLLGGETAEMPGMYKGDDFDLAGFSVGVVNQDRIIDGSNIRNNYAIIGVESSGPHSNGYSLIRYIIKNHKINLQENVPGTKKSWADSLVEPTIIYTNLMLKLQKNFKIGGYVHITGGGFIDNIPRVLPSSVKAVVKKNAWQWPAVFTEMSRLEDLSYEETIRVFNCGIGLVIFAPKEQAEDIIQFTNGLNLKAFLLGKTEQRDANDKEIELV